MMVCSTTTNSSCLSNSSSLSSSVVESIAADCITGRHFPEGLCEEVKAYAIPRAALFSHLLRGAR